MSQKVSIVLVNYNGKVYLKDLLKSIAVQDYQVVDIILVDNDSTDGSIEWLKTNYPEVCLIESKRNEGFGEGCNIGIDYAIAHGAEYVLLMNTDTIPEKNLVSELVKYADSETVTTAKIYCGEKGDEKLWYSGGEINWITAKTNQLLYGAEDRKPTYPVEFISGCCMLLHKNIFEKVGKFDKDFYLYYEDTDFCVRMKKTHIKMLYVTTTSLWHKVGGSSVGGNEMSCSTQYYVTRNRLLFAEKHADLFKEGNLSVLREILRERAFFAGINNEKYELYVKAAIADFLKQDFGRGNYGKILLEERFYVLNGFYEREVGDSMFWYCAGDISASIMIVNPQKCNIIYNISFDVAKDDETDSYLQVEVEGQELRSCHFPEHVEFMFFVEAEQKVKMNLFLQGKNISKSVRSDGNASYYQLLNLKVTEQKTNFYYGKSFLPKESNEENEWYWSTEQTGDIYLVNNEEVLQVNEVRFSVVPYDKNGVGKITILQDRIKVAEIEPEKEVNYYFPVQPKSVSRLTICTDMPVQKGERKLCFNVHDLKVERIKESFYFGNSFYPKESDGVSDWYWSAEQTGDIYLVNNGKALQVNEVRFSVVPYDRNEAGKIAILQDGTKVAEIEPEKEVNYCFPVQPKSVSRLTICTDMPVQKEERNLCFNVNNLRMERIKENFYFGNSFYPKESDGNAEWCWTKEQTGDIFIVNRDDKIQVNWVRFGITPFENPEDATIEILQDGKRNIQATAMENIEFLVEVPPNSLTRLTIHGNLPVCEVDGRSLCFNVNNFRIISVQEYVCFEKSFYAEERNEEDVWYWAYEQEAEISFVFGTAGEAKLSFSIGSASEFTEETIELALDDRTLGKFSYNREICVPVKGDETFAIHRLKFKAAHTPFHVEGDSRKFVFQVLNFCILDSD